MLTLFGGKTNGFCDGVSRRQFLRVGGLGLGALSMPQLLRAESLAGTGSSQKSVIMIFLPGGPPHQDMWDLKMDAPREYRGEFQPMRTNVPGVEICELFPKLAAMADKLTFIRSIVGARGGHDAYQCLTGRAPQNAPPGGWPSIGAVLSKLHGPRNVQTPPFVGLSPKTGHHQWGDSGAAGYLGPAFAPFQPNKGGGAADMNLAKEISLDRLNDRSALLKNFDRFRRQADSSGLMSGLDEYTQQALGVLTSSKLADALDLSKEDPKRVERYGKGDPKLVADGAPRMTEHFLMARRLVEAGARCVTLSFSRWDWHSNNFGRARDDFPRLDKGVSALVQDLHDRGMDKDTTVIVWGEFGRTPKINDKGGRDHWPKVSSALLACGGLNNGQVIGSTDRLGGEADDRPVHFQEVFATLYHSLGIDVKTTTVNDLSGRPRYLVDEQYSPMPELI